MLTRFWEQNQQQTPKSLPVNEFGTIANSSFKRDRAVVFNDSLKNLS